MRKIIVAIDGPAGAGKTSTAKLVAEKLNYIYIDTGAMYRAVTFAWLNSKLELNDDVLKKIVDEMNIELRPSADGQITLLNGVDISEDIRSTEVNQFVSPVSANEYVRKKLVEMQRLLGEKKCCVIDGRDIGTTVFPDAELKIFLTASIDARARRRLLECMEKGVTDLSFDDIVCQIVARDKYDSTRAVSPLRKAEDSIEIDTSDLSLLEQVEIIYQRVIKLIE